MHAPAYPATDPGTVPVRIAPPSCYCSTTITTTTITNKQNARTCISCN